MSHIDLENGRAILHKAKSFWFDKAIPYQPCEPLVGDMDADFCVMGGGIAGVSAAYHLKKLEPSARVVLLEAEVVGYGASGRNAGQLIVSFGGGALGDLVRKYGAQNVGEGYAYVFEGIKLIEELQSQENIDCDYAPTGYLKPGLRIEGDEQIDLTFRLLGQIGQGSHFSVLPRNEVEAELRSPYLGTVTCP